MRTENIKRLKERVLESGGEVFFGDIALEEGEGVVGNTQMPMVTACHISKTEDIRIRAVKVGDNGDLLIIGEDMDGNIIDSVDINDIYEDGIDEITDAIAIEEETIWIRMGVTVKGNKQQIREILSNTEKSAKVLWNLLEKGRFEIDGESYLPSCCIEQFNEEHNTDFNAEQISFYF